jgi:hypothetical protein
MTRHRGDGRPRSDFELKPEAGRREPCGALAPARASEVARENRITEPGSVPNRVRRYAQK